MNHLAAFRLGIVGGMLAVAVSAVVVGSTIWVVLGRPGWNSAISWQQALVFCVLWLAAWTIMRKLIIALARWLLVLALTKGRRSARK